MEIQHKKSYSNEQQHEFAEIEFYPLIISHVSGSIFSAIVHIITF
jgi:hypothetical protein